MKKRIPFLFLLCGAVLALAGCGGKKPVTVRVPQPPAAAPVENPEPPATTATVTTKPETTLPAPSDSRTNSGDEASAKDESISLPADAKPLSVESGLASWYGPPYHNRRGSNGEIYDMHAMTAAHRTLPLGSIVRVTNVKTGDSALVRITDRGPFIDGRILDLSLAAAKKLDVWRPGVTQVKLEVMQTPAPLNTGGRWAVQIGGFEDGDSANKVAGHLTRRYRTANVLCFASPAGAWWVRVRVAGDDRKRAEEVARDTRTPQGSIFLVRLD
ncbi:MAG: septal ring lytic transglycosylase RlpA family protein [Acidobacteria bacterium]|nr:septal ring lytic transglycosylase RlpA family protein [Acidobacteriota bacterium]